MPLPNVNDANMNIIKTYGGYPLATQMTATFGARGRLVSGHVDEGAAGGKTASPTPPGVRLHVLDTSTQPTLVLILIRLAGFFQQKPFHP